MSLPHDPVWNLVPRFAGVPYVLCSWHGETVTGGCPECVREHAEYLATGTGMTGVTPGDGRGVPALVSPHPYPQAANGALPALGRPERRVPRPLPGLLLA